MSNAPHVTIRRYRRFPGWDYSRGASLFITIATEPRCAAFGRVEGGRVLLSRLGEEVEASLKFLPQLNPGIALFGFVVMPDHVHFNVHLAAGLDEPLKVLGKAISRFKVYTTKVAKQLGVLSTPITTASTDAASAAGASVDGRAVASAAGASVDGRAVASAAGASVDGRAMPARLLWQQGYHDRLCLTREFIDATERYIAYNPLKWQLMYGAGRSLAIHEPLDSPCLDAADYWKGVGNVALLTEKLVSVRISRRCSPAQVAAIAGRIDDAVAKGFVILSGFVSPGEKMVRDGLCANARARFVRILPTSIPNRRFRPESRYVRAFAENRYLEIARGNEDVEFTRGACLDYNAEIVSIAKATEGGLALYWTHEGLRKL